MKKLILLLFVLISILNVNAQTNRGTDYSSDVTLFAGYYIQANVIEYGELGFIGGVNIKDYLLTGTFYQTSASKEEFYGLYTQLNFNPRTYYFHIGLAARVGLVNDNFISIEPGFTIQHNNINNKVKFIHQIGWTGGFLSYNVGLIIGNFGPKEWKINSQDRRLYNDYK